jgi:hypothetical protein
MKVWKEIFPIPLISIYIVQRCPLLIGILRRSEDESIVPMNWNYEFKSLLEGDTLMHIQKKLNCETLLQELVSFKQEFDKNQHTLVSNYEWMEIDRKEKMSKTKSSKIEIIQISKARNNKNKSRSK